MNRELKFRTWDKTKNVFIPNDVYALIQTDFNAFGVMIKDWEDYKEGEYFYENAQEISFFTGLKDKNGVEIYEGDELIYIGTNMSSMEVKFIDGCFVGEGPFNTLPLIDYIKALDFQSIEVTGNIYESNSLTSKN